MRTIQFYVPNLRFINWRVVSRTYIELQLKRAQESYRETDNALALLEERIKTLQAGIRTVWETANANDMREFERKYKEVRQENKRLAFVRLRLREAIDEMLEHLEAK